MTGGFLADVFACPFVQHSFFSPKILPCSLLRGKYVVASKWVLLTAQDLTLLHSVTVTVIVVFF